MTAWAVPRNFAHQRRGSLPETEKYRKAGSTRAVCVGSPQPMLTDAAMSLSAMRRANPQSVPSSPVFPTP